MQRLVSLGHSRHALEDFVALCGTASLDVVFDVRRHPRSRWPQFNRAALERSLPEAGITYRWIGDALGGFRDGGYDLWMRTAEFKRGIDELERAATTGVVGFMCSEGEPWKCHRRFVARALSERGHAVSHLLPDGTTAAEDPRLALPDL